MKSSDFSAACLIHACKASWPVLDDLFLARRIADVSAELLQAILHQRYKLRRSIVITSNRVVQD